ncbi:hypothetical protein K456DRAFT_1214867 [Colletotrichum gloeosporioides 23]|nr:hypothetical protein K456DRAFT_1214867 [Colletotrichum gloeosporioides 23]
MSLARGLTAFGRIVQASGGDPSPSGLLAAIAGWGKKPRLAPIKLGASLQDCLSTRSDRLSMPLDDRNQSSALNGTEEPNGLWAAQTLWTRDGWQPGQGSSGRDLESL